MRETGAVIYLAVHKPEEMSRALQDQAEGAVAKAAANKEWWLLPPE